MVNNTSNNNYIGPMTPYFGSDNNKDYNQELEISVKGIENLNSLQPYEINTKVGEFMGQIGDIFLKHFQKHKIEKLGDKKTTLEDAKPYIMEHYYNRLRASLIMPINNDSEWSLICNRRSNIEAFNRMFGSFVDIINTQEIEKMMKELQSSFSIDKDDIPANIPEDFWWYQ